MVAIGPAFPHGKVQIDLAGGRDPDTSHHLTLFILKNPPPVKAAAPKRKGYKNRKNQLTDAQSLPYVSRNIIKKREEPWFPKRS
jgi:hypothetical protein